MSETAHSKTVYSKRSGKWSNPETWEGNKIPDENDHIVVRRDHEVVADLAAIAAASVQIEPEAQLPPFVVTEGGRGWGHFHHVMAPSCRVYWGSHGLHDPAQSDSPHECECARGEDGELLPKVDEEGALNVGAVPYYGPGTNFYGEDA